MFAFPLLFPPSTTHLNALRPAQAVCGPEAEDGGVLRRIRSKKDLDADGGGVGGVVCSSFACWMFAAAVKISLTPRPRGALDSKYVAWIERANVEACSCMCQRTGTEAIEKGTCLIIRHCSLWRVVICSDEDDWDLTNRGDVTKKLYTVHVSK